MSFRVLIYNIYNMSVYFTNKTMRGNMFYKLQSMCKSKVLRFVSFPPGLFYYRSKMSYLQFQNAKNLKNDNFFNLRGYNT